MKLTTKDTFSGGDPSTHVSGRLSKGERRGLEWWDQGHWLRD